MLSQITRRSLSLVMALVLVFSLLPLGAMAEETEPQVTTSETTSPTEATDPSVPETTESIPEPTVSETTPTTEPAIQNSILAEEIQTRIDAILSQYGITADMSDTDIANAIIAVDGDTLYATMMEIEAIDADAMELTEEELVSLDQDTCTLYGRFCDVLARLTAPALLTTVTVLDGTVSITDSANYTSESNGTVTVTAKGGYLSQTTNTITIKNVSGSTATLSFSYNASNYSSFSETSASGTYSQLLENNESFTMSIKGKKAISSNTATLTLSNFSLVEAAASSNVTIKFDSDLGSVTVDNATVNDGEEIKDIAINSSIVMKATASSGSTFLGWINEENNAWLSADASYTYTPSQDITVKAIFVNSESSPHWAVCSTTEYTDTWKAYVVFTVGTVTYKVTSDPYFIFDNLDDATAKASETTYKSVVLMNNSTLSAGDYTIPTGVTVLIPFDDACTQYSSSAHSIGKLETPRVYRKLTLADGANLIVNGAISVSAKHQYAAGSSTGYCTPSGDCGYIDMKDGSSITVNNGGGLYVYGYIIGDGTVTANSGATVYELLQFTDFRGGSQTTDMENSVFPFSQYYVQNIEVPLTLKYGAKEYAFTSIYMSSTTCTTSLSFIGPSDCMFNLTSGEVVKRYDGTTDRIEIDVKGNTEISSVSLEFGGTPIDSSGYVFPLSNNYTIYVRSGFAASISQNLSLLPGSRIIIEQDATCTVNNGISLYVYDQDNWANFCSHTNKTFIPAYFANSRTYTRTNADLVDALVCVNGTVDASAGYIYTTAGGANIYSTGTGVIKTTPGTETKTYQLVQGTGYTEIPITSAKLKNADGSYVDTSSGADTYTYELATGVWHNQNCDHKYTTALNSLPSYSAEGKQTSTCTCGTVSQETAIPKVAQLAAFAASAAEEIILDLKLNVPDTVTKLVVEQKCLDNKVLVTETKSYTINVSEKTVTPEDSTDTRVPYFDETTGRLIITRGVASGEMTLPVTLTFYNGTEIVKVRPSGITTASELTDNLSRTVVNYAELVLQQDENIMDTEKLQKIQKQKNLITYLLTYGGYAQTYYGVDAENPAYDLLEKFSVSKPDISAVTKDTITQALTASGDSIGITATKTQQTFLDSAIYHRVYFTLDSGSDINNYTFKQGFPVNNKDAYQIELAPTHDAANNRYYVDIMKIPAAYLDYMYTITVTNNSTGGTYTVKTSVLAYLDKLLETSTDTNQQNMAKAMYLYNQAANTYFGK